jgi:zinc protease
MKRALALALLLAVSACGKPAPAKVEAEVKKDTSALANIQVVKSPGGITAWLVQEKTVPVVAMEMAWRGGGSTDPAGKDGASWVLGYLMNEGAGDLNSQAFSSRMEDLNMSFGCTIGDDWSGCTLRTLAATRKDSFDTVRLALTSPRFEEEPLARAKRELSVNLMQAETDPGTIASRAMDKALIPGHPSARYATPDTVKTITRDDIVALKNNLMTRDRLLVTVVGDISAADLGAELDTLFGGLPATSTLADVPDAAPAAAPAAPIVVKLPIPQTLVTFSGPGLKRDDPDFYAAYVLNYILGGGGFSSRLMDDIREAKGLTYGIGTGLNVQKHMQRWTGSASTKNATANQVVQLVKQHIGELAKDGPTEKELADAKAYLTGAYPLNFDTNAKIASNLMGLQQDNLGVDYIKNRNGYINAVTLDDLKRVAAKYMKPEAFTFIEVGQPA